MSFEIHLATITTGLLGLGLKNPWVFWTVEFLRACFFSRMLKQLQPCCSVLQTTNIASVGTVGGEAPETPSPASTEENKYSEERVKEEVKKMFPTLQTLVVGHNAPNCYFWCGSTTQDVVVFESSAGSKKSSEPKSWDPVWQKYVGMFDRFISVTKREKIEWIHSFIPLLNLKKISRTSADKHGRRVHPFARLFRTLHTW